MEYYKQTNASQPLHKTKFTPKNNFALLSPPYLQRENKAKLMNIQVQIYYLFQILSTRPTVTKSDVS